MATSDADLDDALYVLGITIELATGCTWTVARRHPSWGGYAAWIYDRPLGHSWRGTGPTALAALTDAYNQVKGDEWYQNGKQH